MTPLVRLILSRLREFHREPSAVFWTYGFPTLLALALGLAFRDGGVQPVSVTVLDGPRQAELVRILSSDPGFAVRTSTEEEARRAFLGGKVVLAIGGDQELMYLFDPTHPQAESTRLRVDDRLQRAAGRGDVLAAANQPVDAQGSRYIDFLIPGLIGMNIMSSSMWGIGYSLVEARKRKLLKRLVATPMRKRDYVLAFILARLVFLASEVAVILVFAVLVFDIVVQGSWLWIAAMSVAGAMAFAGLGMLAASRTQSTETVSGLMNVIMLPMFVMSGVFFTSTHFPDWMQPFIKFLPLTLLNDSIRAVINEGAGFSAIALPFAALTIGAFLTLALALRGFKWT